MENSIVQPVTIRTAAIAVARRITEGFVPRVHLGGRQYWTRLRDGRIEEAPITPPEGVVLDQIAFLKENELTGTTHWHRLFGKMRRHRHTGGNVAHAHVMCEPSYQESEIIEP